MKYRILGKTGFAVSEISFGAWAIGSAWGPVDDRESKAALHRAIECGVNFIDTADVYGDGRSERLIRQVLRERSERIIVATKAGRRLHPHTAAGYNREQLNRFVESSLKNLGVETLDLLQLHCPPPEVYHNTTVFNILDELKQVGKILHYGVSVETVAEAMQAIQHPGVATVQIIFNLFRHKPRREFFAAAKNANVGILARVPLASGLLTGKITRSTQFPSDDHRNYNRFGQVFDRGETFSGVDLDQGLQAVAELLKLLPPNWSLTQFALRWILMFDAVTCAIPGAKTAVQAEENASSSDLSALSDLSMSQVDRIYERYFSATVESLW